MGRDRERYEHETRTWKITKLEPREKGHHKTVDTQNTTDVTNGTPGEINKLPDWKIKLRQKTLRQITKMRQELWKKDTEK
jgi:hypothetical protein